jgi:hypothetical protein
VKRGAIARGFSLWRMLRAEYELAREAAYAAAEDGCRGVLLNARGERAGVSAYSLFMGPWSVAKAYASEELLEWWATHPRVTFAEYEQQRLGEFGRVA